MLIDKTDDASYFIDDEFLEAWFRHRDCKEFREICPQKVKEKASEIDKGMETNESHDLPSFSILEMRCLIY